VKPFRKMTVAASIVGAGLLICGSCTMVDRAVLPHAPANVPVPTLQDYAAQLFTTYLLPVQVVGFMLLIAMLGVIVLSKRFDNAEGAK
jgi:NADH-quinone oxidoreductase subunit J